MEMRGYLDRQKRAIVRVEIDGGVKQAVLNLEIDTGAEPPLLISDAWAKELGIVGQPGHTATLADGSLRSVGVGTARILWLDQWQDVEVVIWPSMPGQAGEARRRGRPDGLLGRHARAGGVIRVGASAACRSD